MFVYTTSHQQQRRYTSYLLIPVDTFLGNCKCQALTTQQQTISTFASPLQARGTSYLVWWDAWYFLSKNFVKEVRTSRLFNSRVPVFYRSITQAPNTIFIISILVSYLMLPSSFHHWAQQSTFGSRTSGLCGHCVAPCPCSCWTYPEGSTQRISRLYLSTGETPAASLESIPCSSSHAITCALFARYYLWLYDPIQNANVFRDAS